MDHVTAAYLQNQGDLLREALTDGERATLAPLLNKLLDSLSARNTKRRPIAQTARPADPESAP